MDARLRPRLHAEREGDRRDLQRQSHRRHQHRGGRRDARQGADVLLDRPQRLRVERRAHHRPGLGLVLADRDRRRRLHSDRQIRSDVALCHRVRDWRGGRFGRLPEQRASVRVHPEPDGRHAYRCGRLHLRNQRPRQLQDKQRGRTEEPDIQSQRHLHHDRHRLRRLLGDARI